MKKKERDDFLNEFSVRLKDVRLTLKMTQDQFSKALEISKPTYVRYELGEMMPKIQILQVLGSKFNVNLNWLFRGDGDMSKFVMAEDVGNMSKFVMSDNVLLREMSLLARSFSRIQQLILENLPEIAAALKLNLSNQEISQLKENLKPLTVQPGITEKAKMSANENQSPAPLVLKGHKNSGAN